MKHRTYPVLFILFLIGYIKPSFAQSEVDLFIEQFATTAISEMNRSKIPASITLAQGILESNSGASRLAIEGNNYFGIKCGSSWSNATVLHKDDDYDENGNLIESCFRAYASPEASFKDHSDFLVDRERYEELFNYGNDYKKWAYGLQKCGYATSKTYGEKLVKLIEKYNLHRYDTKSNQMDATLATNAVPPTRKRLNMEAEIHYGTPPESVKLAADYKRGSEAVDKTQERTIASTAFDSSPDMIESQMGEQGATQTSIASPTIVLQKKYKSKYARAK